MVKVPYSKRERPVVPIPAEPVVEPIDIPGIHEPVEGQAKKILCRMIDWCIEQLLKLKARLRAPLKMELPEIEEEDKT